MFADEMMELFGGIDAEYFLNKLPYKEAISLRNARVKRKNKEFEEEQKLREEEMKEQQRIANRNKIIR
jgi:hypothetical protein